MTSTNRPNLRSTCLVALAIWLVLAALPHTASAQATPPAPALDLAALVLQPADLDAEGMPGYGTDWSQVQMTIEEMMNPKLELESRMWMTPAKVPDAATLLSDAGWIRQYELLLVTPVDPDEPEWYHSGVMSGIEEYASPEGASAAFATFTSEAALGNGHDGTVELLPLATPLGDERVLAHHTFIDEGDTILALTLMARLDNLIVSVNLVDYGNGIEPDPARIERLAGVVMNRIQAARDAGAGAGPCMPDRPLPDAAMNPWAPRTGAPHMPGLDRCVQRMVGGETEAERAYYTVLDGVVIPFFGESDAELAESQAEMTTRGIRDAYQNQYRVDGFIKVTYTYANVYTYTSEAAAVADFAGAEQRRGAEPGYSEIAFTRNPLAIGDESYSFSRRSDASGSITTATYVRFGHIAVGIVITGTSEPIPDSVNALLVSQVACMKANDCTTPIPVPRDVFSAI